MTPKTYTSMRFAYPEICREIMWKGKEVSPRGLLTKELLGASFAILDPTDCLPTKTGRKLNVKFAAADALQVIGGFTDHEWASRWNPRILNYGEHGAYGPRIVGQMDSALDRIRKDRDTRRAVVSIWSVSMDLNYAEEATDYPCTTQFQLMVRDGRLDIHVEMRANDAWYGLPYDVFAFSQLQCTAAALLGMEPGTYYHHATSLHLYQKDWDAAQGLAIDLGPPDPARPMGLTGPFMDDAGSLGWGAITLLAGKIMYDEGWVRDWLDTAPESMGSVGWYVGKLCDE